MTTVYQHGETEGPSHRAVAGHIAPNARSYSSVPALQKKSPEDKELQMKPVVQLASPEEEELQRKSVTQLAKPEEEELQMKSVAQLAKPEEEELQMKPVRQLKSKAGSPILQKEEDPSAPTVNRTGMPDHLKTGIESLSGFSMDDVKVHYNSEKPMQLNALAYAQGTDIHIGPGQERHLPHEAWHVVQQKQGRVRPTIQAKGVAINDDKGLEKEADVMGGKGMEMKPESTQNNTPVFTHSKTIQCKPHKPQLNSKVMYNAGGPAGPTVGERCTVLASADDGSLTIRRDRDNYTYPAKDWKTDPIWLEYPADPKDTDRRRTDAAWTALTKTQKATVYSQAKTQALTHIKTSVIPEMLNATNRANLNNHLSIEFFSKIRRGEWQATWEEPYSKGRKWQFTIDMDDPLETSWQAAHVGWEVKLLDRGANNAVPPVAYPAFAKQQGHVWLNDVPEARDGG